MRVMLAVRVVARQHRLSAHLVLLLCVFWRVCAIVCRLPAPSVPRCVRSVGSLMAVGVTGLSG